MTEEQETEVVLDLLKWMLDEHDAGECCCDLTDGGFGLCFAGQWSEGCIDNAEVIQTLAPERRLSHDRRKTDACSAEHSEPSA